MGRTLRAVLLVLLGAHLAACATDTIENRRHGQQMVCHDGEKTLSLSNASAHNHIQHGDKPGPCPSEN